MNNKLMCPLCGGKEITKIGGLKTKHVKEEFYRCDKCKSTCHLIFDPEKDDKLINVEWKHVEK